MLQACCLFVNSLLHNFLPLEGLLEGVYYIQNKPFRLYFCIEGIVLLRLEAPENPLGSRGRIMSYEKDR